uniref:Uncharacterized protein n=1 Tax=viral metagenome TaxID=1070528 RepID=A0A6C0B3M2_9ZZZZ
MRFHNKHLDLLASGQTKILVFDCEFWHVLGETGDQRYTFPPNEDFFFVSREIGGFLLNKNKDGSWSYNGPFFVTLSKPKREVSFPISKYATVEPATARKLDELEDSLGLAWGVSFPSRLSPEGNEALEEGLKVYANDPNVKSHHKPPSWYGTFMKHYAESSIIVKGTGDIDALKNAAAMYGFEYTPPKHVIDIALWNHQSRRKCGTAKLEGTYNCIKRHLDPETKELAKHLPLEKAHNPSTDASMTLIVALYIQSVQPK